MKLGGEFKCPKENGFECFRQAETKYKFYLSFENAMCREYVTEKFFTIYSLNMIPGSTKLFYVNFCSF